MGINPAIVALFNLMGLWPLAYASLALADGQGQRIPAWPFVVGSFGLGAFAMLPYLVLRSPYPTPVPAPAPKWLESRWLGAVVLVGAVVLLTYGVVAGDWANFVQQWQTCRFIHVMSLDFCALALLVPTLVGDDMARRNIFNPGLMALITAVPLVGIAAYLTLRPPVTGAAPQTTPSPAP